MSASDPEKLNSDNIFEILSNPRRRMVLYYLRKHGGNADVRELAKEIASMENEIPVEDLSDQQRKRVYVSLYQTHLPKMAGMNTIQYDKEAGTVSLTEQANDIDQYLTKGDSADYPWTFHYVVLAGISATVIVLSVLDAPLFSSAPLLWLGLGIAAMFVLSAVVQTVLRTKGDDIPFELSQYDR